MHGGDPGFRPGPACIVPAVSRIMLVVFLMLARIFQVHCRSVGRGSGCPLVGVFRGFRAEQERLGTDREPRGVGGPSPAGRCSLPNLLSWFRGKKAELNQGLPDSSPRSAAWWLRDWANPFTLCHRVAVRRGNMGPVHGPASTDCSLPRSAGSHAVYLDPWALPASLFSRSARIRRGGQWKNQTARVWG